MSTARRHIFTLKRFACSALWTVAALLCGLSPALAANLPTGGSVSSGSASIGSATGTTLTVTQSSSSAVINWQSFSVGQGYTVNFVQPSSSSAILNRVTGSATSVIAGSITANGHVYLLNPNGIVITSTGTVNTGAFVASTLGISDADFMAGKRTFTGDGASASVVNQGVITIGRGGYAALLGGAVDNAGAIVVPLGKVALGSGEQATLDLSGDGFLQVAVPTSATGAGALVANSGRIVADGGLVMLSAAAAKDIARQAINMSGVIEAKSAGGVSGDVVLAGADGSVSVSGTIDATSADGAGGAVTVTGRDIALAGASVDVSGATGGGAVRIGGDKQGAGTLAHADTVTVDTASTIKADATASGNGGSVVIWSDALTTFAGTISARGGATSGDGGDVEVSGKARLAYTGFTDLSAAHGSFGTLLLDPYNVTISTGGDTSGFTATSDDSIINATTLLTALGSANVVVSTGSGGSQSGDITVSTALSWNSGTTLTLTAAGSIAINAGVSIGGSGGLALTYGSDLTFGNGASVTYTKADGSAATSSQGGTLSINGVSYTLLYSMAEIDAIDSTGLSGHYALARSLDASGTTYTDALVGISDTVPFIGTFEGLGQTITGLTISKSGEYTGLFGYVDTGGVVRDIGLVGGTISGGALTGSLVGYNYGTISNAYSSSTVSGTNGVGGLVGENDNILTDSYATGSVSGSNYVGGLAGISYGTLSGSYATGAVTGSSKVGGLAGSIYGSVSNVYAAGSVTGTATDTYVGGLAGNSVATLSNAYATGAVSGVNYVGGLIGYLLSTATVTDSFATSAVKGTKYVGGLVGYNAGSISYSYSIGAVSGTTYIGGLVGRSTGSVINSYWDTETSGWTSSSGGGTGLTTATLQDGGTASGLGSGFTLTAGLFPYLIGLFPDGVQTISGVAYKDVGTTVAASGSKGAVTVTALSGGTLLGAATTGANGYYYIMMAAGTFSSGDGLLTYTTASATTGAANAATYGAASSAALQDGYNLYAGMLMLRTGSATLSGAGALTNLHADALTAAGGDTAATTVISATTGTGYVAPNDFTIDTSVTSSAPLVFATTSGNDLTVNAPITLGAGGDLWLLSGGALTINALIYAQDSDSVSLAYATSFTYGSSGRLTYSTHSSRLTLNGTVYTLIYSIADIEAIVTTGLSGHYALANNIDASGVTYSGALVSGTFTGVFEGQNNVITGLTIVSTDDSVGLFDTIGSAATVRNLGLSGASVSTTGYYAGLLAGMNLGTVSNVFATGQVSGYSTVGGLVGYNLGTVKNAYAMVAVSGSDTVGGLVGENDATISNAYSSGAVSGTSTVGGLVGYNAGTIDNAYWNTQTSGQSSGIGQDDNPQTVTGLTTAQLQDGNSASGLGSSFTLSSGLYPFLASFYPSGAQAVSGTVYTDAGTTVAASGTSGAITVTALLGGTLLGTATTGADGSFYILTAAGAFSGGGSLLAYTTASAATGATDSVTYGAATSAASQSDFNLYGNMLTLRTAAATLSTAPSLTSLQASALTAAGSDAAAQAAITATTERGLIATSAFTIDQPLNVSSQLFIATTSGTSLTVAKTIAVQDGASISLLSGGALDINAAITVLGAGAVAFSYDDSATTNLSFGSGGGLTYAKADGSAASASQGGTLTINGDAYTLLYSMAELASLPTSTIASLGITGYQGDYALATSLDASGATYSEALIGASSTLYGSGDYHPFVGTLEGLGHTITGLTISKTSDGYAGMFGAIGGGGVVRDITLANISVASAGGGTSYTGGLVGFNSGVLANVTITGNVSGLYIVGGLVGDNEGGAVVNARVGVDVDGTASTGGGVGGLAGFSSGTISNSYSTGTVTGTSSTAYMGGLVGENYLHGIITNSYATGAVIGGSTVGGLVGMSHGAVEHSYSTGAVTGVNYVGGLIGYNDDFDLGGTGSTLVSSYWDTDTSGTTSATGHGGSSGATGLSTAQFQDGSSASGLGSAFSLTSGLYPYLTSLFPNGVQTVSGHAYKDSGATLLTSGSSGAGVVYVKLSDGTVITTTTGANGYYYAFFASGGIDTTSGSPVLAYTAANANTGATNAITFISSTKTSPTSVDIYGGWLTETVDSGTTTLSTLDTAYAAAISGTSLAGYSLANRSITALATGFTIDGSVSVSGTLVVSAPGSLTIAAGGGVSATDVSLEATGAFINNAGSGAVTASDRWLIYSADSDGDTFGGLDSGNTAVWSTAAGGTVSASGNRYVFAAAQEVTITVTTTNASKIYGTTADVSGNYVITSAADGVSGAYLSSAGASTFSGAPSVSSSGSAASATMGSYSYTLDLGTLTAASGYVIKLVNTGTLTVMYPAADSATLASAALRYWRYVASPILPNPPLETLDVTFSTTGGEPEVIYSSPRLTRLVMCRGVGNCLIDIPQTVY